MRAAAHQFARPRAPLSLGAKWGPAARGRGLAAMHALMRLMVMPPPCMGKCSVGIDQPSIEACMGFLYYVRACIVLVTTMLIDVGNGGNQNKNVRLISACSV